MSKPALSFLNIPMIVVMRIRASPRGLLSLFLISIFCWVTAEGKFHLTIVRRGGSLATREPVNLTHLVELVEEAESRYAKAERVLHENKVIRKWKSEIDSIIHGGEIINGIGQDGSW